MHRDNLALLRDAHLFFQCLYETPTMLGQRMMDVIIWARGKFLLLACDFGIVQFSLMSRLRIRLSQYTWAFFQSKSVVYCRLFLQPELKPFLYVGSTAQSLGDRERTRWGKSGEVQADTSRKISSW